jgi:histidine ammonia-lyase
LVKTHQFSLGHSGVNPVAVESLLKLLERRVIPVVPKYGSVGDGDLAPHAHIARVLIGEGEARRDGRVVNGRAALKAARIQPTRLSNKEALSLISGTAYSTAIAALAIRDSHKILHAANIAAAAGYEIIQGNKESYSAELTGLKDVNVQEVARQLRRLMRGSSYQRRRLQDPLSFRCVPQVHGTVLEIFRWAQRLVEAEANSVADNPIIVGDRVFHGGNFYDSSVAVAADVAVQGLTYLAGASDRRTQILLKENYTDLPEYLSSGEGDVGMMIAQYSAAALTARLRALANPFGVHSIPTSGFQEDIVPMTTNACIRLHECVEACQKVIAIELCVAYAALRLKKDYGSVAAKKIASTRLSDELSERFIQMEKLILDGTISEMV